MKTWIISLLVFCLSITQMTIAADSKPQRMQSRQIFLDAMGNPLVSEIFRQDQLGKFSSRFDNDLRTFFTQDPYFSQLYQVIFKNYHMVLTDFANSMLISSTRLDKGITSHYDIIRKIVNDTALDLGFSQSAINKMELYVIGGDENAFTVSGLQDRIIVVFQRDILRTLSHGELRAVIGHELGHIRAQHVIVGQVHQIMLQLLGTYMVNGPVEVTDSEGEESLRNMQEALGFGDKLYGSMPHSDGNRIEYEAMSARKKNFSDQLNQMMHQFMKQPEEIKREFFVNYLSMLVENLEAVGSFSETILFFKSILEDIRTKEYFRPVRLESAKFHLTIASFAASQAFEETSDRISNSVVKREYLASSMAKLLGADFDGSRKKSGFENRNERRRIIQQLLKQANEFFERNKGDMAAQYLSMMTHPAPVIRVHDIMNLEKYPAIIFADPFLRNLYLRDLLVGQIVDMELKYKKLEEALQEVADSKENLNLIKKIKQYMSSIESSLGTLVPVYFEHERKLIEMILNNKKGGITSPFVKTKVERSDSDNRGASERQVSGAPRYLALIRYMSNGSKELISKYVQLKKMYDQETDENSRLVYRYNMSIIEKQLEKIKEFIIRVIIEAKRELLDPTLSVDSKNLITTRISYLEKVVSLKTSKELLESLIQSESNVSHEKRISIEEYFGLGLFNQEYLPLVVRTQSVRVNSLCANYFGSSLN